MKIKGHIDIEQPLNKVVELFSNPDYLKEYQDGFVKKDFVSGTPGQTGAIAKMFYKSGRHDIELTETITNNNLPQLFEAAYHHVHMDNTMTARFKELSPNNTRYEYEYEYTRISWVMPKLMALLFPGMYRKPVEKWLRQFKEFAEQR